MTQEKIEGMEELQTALDALEEEGAEIVPVPISLMRNALWYYENYFVQRERADLVTGDYNDCVLKAQDLQDEKNKLQTWTVGLGIYSVVSTFITVLSLAIAF